MKISKTDFHLSERFTTPDRYFVKVADQQEYFKPNEKHKIGEWIKDKWTQQDPCGFGFVCDQAEIYAEWNDGFRKLSCTYELLEW